MTENCVNNHFTFSKPPYGSVDTKISIAGDDIAILGPVEPLFLNKLSLAGDMNSFRPYLKQHQALVELASEPDGLIFAAINDDLIVSYTTFQKPDYPWWENRCFNNLIELGIMETSLKWRRRGISKFLFESIFLNNRFSYFEDFIVIAFLFAHGWDLESTGLSSWAYRNFMVKFFEKYGFTAWDTIDPEVMEDPCNTLMARIGSNTSSFCLNRFNKICTVEKI